MRGLERGFAAAFRWLAGRGSGGGCGDVEEALGVSLERLRARRASRGVLAAALFGLRELADMGVVRRRRSAARREDGAAGGGGWEPWRDGVRGLRAAVRRPLLTAGVVGTLAFGIAVTSVMFGVVSTVLWRPLPYDHADRVVMIWGDVPQIDLGYPEVPMHGTHFSKIRDEAKTLAAVAAFKADLFNLDEGSTRERLDGVRATGGFFRAVGVRPALGRFFDRTEEAPGRDRVVVLSWSLWRSAFNADASVVGRTIRLNGQPYTVIGVAPEGFDFPRGGEMPGSFQMPERARLWVPMAPATRGPSDLALVARVKPGVGAAAVQGDLDRVTRMLEEERHVKGWYGTRAVPLRTQVVGDRTPMLLLLFGAVALVMLITCANAAQLLLASAIARRQDFAVRTALGASRARLIRQLLAEALALAALAGVAGALLARLGAGLVRTLGPAQMPRLADVHVDGGVLGFALALTALTGVLFGVAPAIVGARVDPYAALRAGGRGGTGLLPSRMRRALLVTEVALSLVLLAGAGLLLRSLAAQYRTDLGFRPEGTLTFEVTLPEARYPEERHGTHLARPKLVAALDDALRRLRDVPGVRAASLAKPLPLSGAQEASVYLVEGRPVPDPKDLPIADYVVVGPSFFRTMGSSLVKGREFTGADDQDALQVVVVNRAMAQLLWPGEDPIGKRIRLPAGDRSWRTVVGVAPDVKELSVTEKARPIMFVPYRQDPYPSLGTVTLLVRTTGAPLSLVAPIRRAIAGVDPDLPLAKIRTVDDLVGEATAEPRFATVLLGGFAIVASLLAALGLAGLTAFIVAQRRRELGVRVALGATRRRILVDVLGDGLKTALVGSAAGLLVALLATRLLGSMLYGVSSLDPLTFALAPAVLVATIVAACAVPAWKAAGVDPRSTLDAG